MGAMWAAELDRRWHAWDRLGVRGISIRPDRRVRRDRRALRPYRHRSPQRCHWSASATALSTSWHTARSRLRIASQGPHRGPDDPSFWSVAPEDHRRALLSCCRRVRSARRPGVSPGHQGPGMHDGCLSRCPHGCLIVRACPHPEHGVDFNYVRWGRTQRSPHDKSEAARGAAQTCALNATAVMREQASAKSDASTRSRERGRCPDEKKQSRIDAALRHLPSESDD